MSIHEDPKEALLELWAKQFNDERLYVQLKRLKKRMIKIPSTAADIAALSERLKHMQEQLREGRRLLGAMHLHIKTHNEEQSYVLRPISSIRYSVYDGVKVTRHTVSVTDLPLKIRIDGSFDVADPTFAMGICIDLKEPYILRASSAHPFRAYLNGHRYEFHSEPQLVGTHDHIMVGNTSLIIDWIERKLHHRATGRVIKHGPISRGAAI